MNQGTGPCDPTDRAGRGYRRHQELQRLPEVAVHHGAGVVVIDVRLWLVGKPDVPRPKDDAGSVLGGDDSVTPRESVGCLEGDVTILVAESTDEVKQFRSRICAKCLPKDRSGSNTAD